ncbi:hypothetical protein [Paenibacillus naphthalenovorans]|uniref:hypothetical protein n=1 Tax=Paenibacillus naphthalenovorans TaxID=162209 RepID=UPI003D2BEF08
MTTAKNPCRIFLQGYEVKYTWNKLMPVGLTCISLFCLSSKKALKIKAFSS